MGVNDKKLLWNDMTELVAVHLLSPLLLAVLCSQVCGSFYLQCTPSPRLAVLYDFFVLCPNHLLSTLAELGKSPASLR